jgi:hypothetical protein
LFEATIEQVPGPTGVTRPLFNVQIDELVAVAKVTVPPVAVAVRLKGVVRTVTAFNAAKVMVFASELTTKVSVLVEVL